MYCFCFNSISVLTRHTQLLRFLQNIYIYHSHQELGRSVTFLIFREVGNEGIVSHHIAPQSSIKSLLVPFFSLSTPPFQSKMHSTLYLTLTSRRASVITCTCPGISQFNFSNLSKYFFQTNKYSLFSKRNQSEYFSSPHCTHIWDWYWDRV